MMRKRRIAMAAMVAAQPLAWQAAQAATPMAVVEIVGVAPLAGMGIERKQLPYAVQTASGKEVEQAHRDNLGDYLAWSMTGVNVNEISGSPFQNDITYRGFRASPVLGTSQGISVYLDGVRVNEPFGDVVNWDMLPETAISRVLLAPGSNPLYGMNTLGGALALNTKSGASHPGLSAGFSGGGNRQRRADLAYGASVDGWHGFAAATLFDDGGWREHSAGHLGNLFLKAGRTQGATDWQVTLLAGQSRLVGNGLLPSYRWDGERLRDGLYEANRRAAYTFPDETRNRLHQAQFSLIRRLGEQVELAVGAYARNSRRDTVNGDISDGYANAVLAGQDVEDGELHTASLNTTSTRQRSHGFSANLSGRSVRHQWMAGASHDRSKVTFAQFEQEADFTPQRAVLAGPGEERELDTAVAGASRSVGLYLADTWSIIPNTWLTAAARYNHARVANTLSNDGVAQPRESFSYKKLNPSLGVSHQAAEGLTLFANLAQSNRVPTVIELGCADPEQPCRLPVGLQSDPYLKQVVSRTAEAGVRWRGGRDAKLSLSLYRTANRDDILFRSAGLTQHGYFANFGRTLHRGLDLSGEAQAGAFTARLGYSYLKAVHDAEGDLFTGTRRVRVTPGTPIAGLPRHTLKLSVDWKATPALSFGADTRAVSSLVTQGNEDGLRADAQPGVAPQHANWRIRGHALLTLRASYKPHRHWELFARINNVANRSYETFGAVGVDMLPDGRLLQPGEGGGDAGLARFVAPGAPRSLVAGLRYRF